MKPRYIVIALGTLFFVILFLRTAWLCDDAYISFRTVDNAVNGYGLRWNVNERVQAYTHPLWMFLHIPFYAITKEMFLTGIFISFGVSLLTIILLLTGIAQNLPQVLIATSILGFSRAYIDFSSSGLENPMSHLLLVIFMIVFLQQKFTIKRLLLLSFIASLATLNRQDCVLLYIPALVYVWWKVDNRKIGFIYLCLGFIPLVLWEIFSVIYYGFPFPNTAYAKLGTGLWKIDLIKQGLWYYAFSWKRDFITLLVLFLSFTIPFYQKQKEIWACVLGIFLYCLYVIWIGGDFMGGRFFTVPLLLATIVIIRYSNLDKVRKGVLPIFIFLLSGIFQPNVPILANASFGKDSSISSDAHGIADERMAYFQMSGLVHWRKGKTMPASPWSEQGKQYRLMNQEITRVHGSVGYRGYFAGPKVHLIDYYALAEPLLARLPAVYKPSWRIGHFFRFTPEGYEESAGSDLNLIKDKNLAEFYEHLKIITQAPIFSSDRFITILKMNLGMYNHLIDRDRYKFPLLTSISIEKLSQLAKSDELITISRDGLEICFDSIRHNSTFQIELDSYDQFMILFFRDKEWIGRRKIEQPEALEPFTKYTVYVPYFVRWRGFNAIRIFTYPGDADSKMKTINLTDKHN